MQRNQVGMEQRGRTEGKGIESVGNSKRRLATGRERSTPVVGLAVLRVLRNLSWSRGLRIPRRLLPPTHPHRSPGATLYYSDHESVRCCAAFCRCLEFHPSTLSLPSSDHSFSGQNQFI